MAKGFPDFFGTSIFPVHGSMTLAEGNGNHSGSGNADTLVTITGKGIIKGLDVAMYNAGQDGKANSVLYLTIDNLTNLILQYYNFADTDVNIDNPAFGYTPLAIWEGSRLYCSSRREIPFISEFKLVWLDIYTAGVPNYTYYVAYQLYQ